MRVPKRKTIALFTYQLGGYSGAAFQAIEIAKRLGEFDFLVFNQDWGKGAGVSRIEPNILVINLPANKILQAAVIVRETIKSRIRIFHCHGFILIGLLVGALLGRRIILKSTLCGDDDAGSIASSSLGWFKIRVFRLVDLNIVLSNALQAANMRYLDAGRILKIPNGVSFRRAEGEKSGSPVFCTVGLVSARKRTLEAIEYFKKNYSRLRGSRMYVVGPDSEADGLPELDREYVRRCKESAASEGGKVVFTGRLSKEATRRIFGEAAGFILFSEREGMPNVLLEAMAEDCVPIVTAMGGVCGEVIDNGRDGFILETCTQPVDFEDVLRIGRSRAPSGKIERAFRIDAIAQRYRAIYAGMK